MATGKKRSRRSSGSAAVRHGGAVATDATASAAPQTTSTGTEDAAEFAQEYSYVRRDLRQLFIISAVLFAIMVGIGFLI